MTTDGTHISQKCHHTRRSNGRQGRVYTKAGAKDALEGWSIFFIWFILSTILKIMRFSVARRGPWALTIYFAFLLCLLLWGRVPTEADCRDSGMRLISAGAHQIMGQGLPTPYCPACDGQGEGTLCLAMPGSVAGALSSKEAPQCAFPLSQQRTWPPSARSISPPPFATGSDLPDPRQRSLRTVVLLH